MLGGRKAAHVDADLGDDGLGAAAGDAGDGVEVGDGGLKRAHPFLDLGVHGLDLGLQELHLVELAAEHEALMAADAPLQGELQLGLLPAHAGLGQRGQLGGVLLALGERPQHCPAADPHDVGGHVAQLDVGALQRLLEPAHHVRALVDQAGAGSGPARAARAGLGPG